MTRTAMSLVAVHLAGNALLLWLGYYWLGLGESRTPALLWSLAVALAIVSAACVLHGAAFAFFAVDERNVTGAFRTALRHLVPVLAAALVAALLYALISRMADSSVQPGFNIASWLTLKLRRPVKPAAILRVFNGALWILRWVVVPILIVPMAAGASFDGWRGLKPWARRPGRRLYWIAVPVLLLGAFWLPFRILGWIPFTGSFTTEILSFSARLLVAYLLFVGCWLLLAFLTSAGRPVLSQAKTTASP